METSISFPYIRHLLAFMYYAEDYVVKYIWLCVLS